MTRVMCDHCGTESALFGAGGATDLARQTGLPLLAQLPFFPALAAASDTGRPPLLDDPDSVAAAQFHALATQLARNLELTPGLRA
jgi:ATP-binding protein involved in chromosome partitioning